MVVVRGSACRAAICTSRRGTPASDATMMNPTRSMCGWTVPRLARLPIERTHRCAVRRSKRCPSLRRRIGRSWRSPPSRSIVPAVRGDGRSWTPQAALLHGGAVQLDMRPRRLQHDQLLVGRPLEERTQVMSIRVEGPAAVTSEKRNGRQLRLIKRLIRYTPHRRRGLFECRHRLNLHARGRHSEHRSDQPAVWDARARPGRALWRAPR
jgi:hypothetical protein